MKLKLFLILVFLLVIFSPVYAAETISKGDKITILNNVLLPLVASHQTFQGYESRQSLLFDIKEVFGADPICGILGDEKYTWDLSQNKVQEGCDKEIDKKVTLGINQEKLFTLVKEALGAEQFCVVVEENNFLLLDTKTKEGYNLKDITGFDQYCKDIPVFRYTIEYTSAKIEGSFQKGNINIPFTVEAEGALSSIIQRCLPIIASPKKCAEIQSKAQDLIFLTYFNEIKEGIIKIDSNLRPSSTITSQSLPSAISPITSLPQVIESQGTISQRNFKKIENVETLINDYENLFIDFEGKQIKYQDLIERSANSQIASQALYEEALGYKSIAEMQRDYEGIEVIATTHFKGIGEPCSTDNQCKSDLACLKSVCTKKEEEVKPGQPKPTEVKDESLGLSTDYEITTADKKILDEIELKYGSYVDIILDENTELNLIPKGLILATIWEESKGQQYTLSAVDAAGLTQLRPPTARAQGLTVPEYTEKCKCTLTKLCITKESVEAEGCTIDVDDRFNIKKSIYGGMSYYKFVLNLNQIKNNWYKAISGYNSGPSSPFLLTNPQNPSLDEFPNKGYVSRVIAGWQYYSSKISKMGCGYCASISSQDGIDCSEKECEALGSDCEWDSNNIYQYIVRNKGTCTTTKIPEKEKTAITGALCYPLPENSLSSVGDKKNFGDLRESGTRCHIGNDIYTKAPGEVIAIDDGELIKIRTFTSCETKTNWGLVKESKASGEAYAVLVYHPNLDVTINYGEIDIDKVKVSMSNKEIKKGQLLGIASYCGMLHFEVYSGQVNDIDNWKLSQPLTSSQKCTSSTPGKPDSVLDATAFIKSQSWQICTTNQDFTTVTQPKKDDDQITSSTTEGFCFPFEEKPNSIGSGDGGFGGSRITNLITCSDNRCHSGIDIFPKDKVPAKVRAIETGKITFIGKILSPNIIANTGETDIAIKIYSDESKRTILYGELKKDSINSQFKKGDIIKKETVLGETILQKSASKTMLHLEMYDNENSAETMGQNYWCAPKGVTKCNIKTAGKPQGLVDPTSFINSLNNQNGYQCKSENKVSGASGIDFISYTTKCTDSVAPTSERVEGMMIPKGIKKGDDVTVNFYFHGHKAGINQNFVSGYIQEKDFLRKMEALTQAGGKEILVVLRGSNNHIPCPTPNNPGNTGDACRWMDGNNFGCYYDEAIKIVTDKGYNPTSFSLSGHSGGGKAVSNVISSPSFTAVKSKLKDVIFYDACYGNCQSVQQNLPNTNIFIYDTGGKDTQADISAACKPNSAGICQNSKVYLEKLGSSIGHGDVPTKCFLQHIIGGTCTSTSPLIASAGLPGAPGNVIASSCSKKVLMIGDSHFANSGNMGEFLQKSLSKNYVVQNKAVGGSNTNEWVSSSTSTKVYSKNQHDFNGLITAFNPDTILISLGTNDICSPPSDYLTRTDSPIPCNFPNNLDKRFEALINQIPSTTSCYFIGPPKMVDPITFSVTYNANPSVTKTYKFSNTDVDKVYTSIETAISSTSSHCVLVDSRLLTSSGMHTPNAQNQIDKIHIYGSSASQWAQGVYQELIADQKFPKCS